MATVIQEPKDTRFEGLGNVLLKGFEGYVKAKRDDKLNTELDSIASVMRGGDAEASREALLGASPEFKQDPRYKTAIEDYDIAYPDRVPVIIYGPNNESKTIMTDPKMDLGRQIQIQGPGWTSAKKPSATIQFADGTFGDSFIDPNKANAALNIIRKLEPGARLVSKDVVDTTLGIRGMRAEERRATAAEVSAGASRSATAVSREKMDASVDVGMQNDPNATRVGIINRVERHSDLEKELGTSLGGRVSEDGTVSFGTNKDLQDSYNRSLALGDTIMNRGGTLGLARDAGVISTLTSTIETLKAQELTTEGQERLGTAEELKIATGKLLPSERAEQIFQQRVGVHYDTWIALKTKLIAQQPSMKQSTDGNVYRTEGIKYIKVNNELYPIPG